MEHKKIEHQLREYTFRVEIPNNVTNYCACLSQRINKTQQTIKKLNARARVGGFVRTNLRLCVYNNKGLCFKSFILFLY